MHVTASNCPSCDPAYCSTASQRYSTARPDSSACSRAAPSTSSARSSATTSAPARASASLNMPPPQPTSQTRAPSSFVPAAMKPSRAGLRSWSAREGPFGSHQRDANALNRWSSAGSTFALAAVGMASRRSGRRPEPLAPTQRALAEFDPVDAAKLAVRELPPPRDPDVAHLAPAGRVHEVRGYVVDGRGLERVEPDRGQVGILAGLDAAHAFLESERAGAAGRRHAERGLGRQRAGVAGYALGQERRGAHLAEHVAVVVAGAAVGAEREGR